MVNLTTYELMLIAGKGGIKNYKDMSREKLLNALDESERNFNTLSEKGLEQIEKMQNLPQNELKQVIKMQNQSRDELEQIAKMRRIKNYEDMSKEGLLIALLKSEQSPAKLHNKVEENKVEETKKYPDHNGLGYERIRRVKDLFDEIDKNYYEPVIIKSSFKNNYIVYQSRGDKEKTLSPEEYLDMIRPYLRDLINNHQAPLEGYSGNDNNLHGEWKIQLTMQINFVSSLDPGEIRTVDSKNKNIEILVGSKTDNIIELFESFLQKYQEELEEK